MTDLQILKHQLKELHDKLDTYSHLDEVMYSLLKSLPHDISVIEAAEEENEQLNDRITMLEGELAHVQAENADLRDEMEAMTNGGMRNE